MVVGVAVGRYHDDQEVGNGFAIRRIEVQGEPGAHEQRQWLRDAGNARVRNRHSLAERGRADLLAPQQRAERIGSGSRP